MVDTQSCHYVLTSRDQASCLIDECSPLEGRIIMFKHQNMLPSLCAEQRGVEAIQACSNDDFIVLLH